MNVWGKSARSWRKARKRGVSPIIATILLVAITVVLAAVLYVLISGLTHGTGSPPLGTEYGWGSVNNVTAATAALTQCTGGDPCYSLDVASAGAGITTSSVTFTLHGPTGGVIAFPAATVIYLVSVTSAATLDTYTISSSSWASAQVFAPGDTIVVNTGAATSKASGLFGDALVAIGGSGYSGTVTANAFT